MWIESPKGPVLPNYGIYEARFTKPVYPGMAIGVKFLVDVYDETGETVAIATILTMARKLEQG